VAGSRLRSISRSGQRDILALLIENAGPEIPGNALVADQAWSGEAGQWRDHDRSGFRFATRCPRSGSLPADVEVIQIQASGDGARPTEPRRPEGGKARNVPDTRRPFLKARIAVGAVYKIVALCRSMMRQRAIFIGRSALLIDQNPLRHWRGDRKRCSCGPFTHRSRQCRKDCRFFEIEKSISKWRGPRHVATGCVHDAFWLTRRPGSVEDEEQIFAIHLLAWAICCALGGDQVAPNERHGPPPQSPSCGGPPRFPFRFRCPAVRRAPERRIFSPSGPSLLDRFVNGSLKGNTILPFASPRLRSRRLCSRRRYPVDQGVRAKPSEGPPNAPRRSWRKQAS